MFLVLFTFKLPLGVSGSCRGASELLAVDYRLFTLSLDFHILRDATFLAIITHYCVVLASVRSQAAFGCRLLALGGAIFTSYVSCPVLRALPAVTKVDG